MHQNRIARYFHNTPEQWPFLLTGLIPTFLFCSFSSILVFFFHQELISIVQPNADLAQIQRIQQWSFMMIGFIWVFFVLVYIWIHALTSRTVGAFGRILKEVDAKVVENNFKKPIQTRTQDRLAQQFLKRINILFDKLQSFKNKPRSSEPNQRF